jgi:pilus assembly protein CpaB
MKRPVIFVALAGIAAMLASVVVYSALKKREAEVQKAMVKTVYIVVAANDLPLGSKIDPGQVKLARWSADAMPDGAFTNPSQVVGSFVKSQFVSNEPVVATKLFLGQKTAGVMPLLIPVGMRAVSVQVDEVSDIAGFVLPHAHVDILVALANQGGGGPDKPFSKIVLQNVEVLAVGEEVEKKKDDPELVKVVTVIVTPQDAERLALATREGTLHLAMRNYADSRVVLTSGTDVDQMLHQYSLAPLPVMAVQHESGAAPRPMNKFQIEIYRNGKSAESVSFVSQALTEGRHHHSSENRDAYTAASVSDHPGDEGAKSDSSAAGSDSGSPASNPTAAALPPTETVEAHEPSSFAPKGRTIEIP